MRRHRRLLLHLGEVERGRRIQLRKPLAEVVIDDRLRIRQILGVALPAQRLVDIDVLLERERRVQHRLHPLTPVLLDGLLDLPRVIGGMLDDVLADLPLAALEQHVVLGEIRMPQHVCRHQHVLGEPVARSEIGVTRIAREHHLEQPRIAHVPLDELVDVADAERPVRHAHRQAVHGDLHHEAVRNGFEVDRVKIQARAGRKLFDAADVRLPVLAHVSTALLSAVKKWRTAPHTSS